MTNKKKLWLGIVILLIVMTLLLYPFFSKQKKASHLLNTCHQLILGMSLENMTQLMGEPVGKQEGREPNSEFYVFESPWLASTQTMVAVKNGKITEIICGER